MASNKAPAYQWFPKDAETDEAYRLMNCEQLGIYERLRDHQWLEGSLPSDVAQLAVIVGHGMTVVRLRKLWPGVSPCFPKNRQGRLQNARLERQRKAHRSFVETQSSNGQKGAAKRWGRHSTAIQSPLANDSSASASASASPSAFASAKQEQDPGKLKEAVLLRIDEDDNRSRRAFR